MVNGTSLAFWIPTGRSLPNDAGETATQSWSWQMMVGRAKNDRMTPNDCSAQPTLAITSSTKVPDTSLEGRQIVTVPCPPGGMSSWLGLNVTRVSPVVTLIAWISAVTVVGLRTVIVRHASESVWTGGFVVVIPSACTSGADCFGS
jgi:hypothetical protein